MAATRILVVEDEFLIALDIAGVLEQAGIAVIGPAGTVGDALQALASEEVHGALLDAHLGGDFGHRQQVSLARDLEVRRERDSHEPASFQAAASWARVSWRHRSVGSISLNVNT